LNIVFNEIHFCPVGFVPALADVVEYFLVILNFHHIIVVLVLFFGIVDSFIFVGKLVVDSVNLVHIGFLRLLDELPLTISNGVELAGIKLINF